MLTPDAKQGNVLELLWNGGTGRAVCEWEHTKACPPNVLVRVRFPVLRSHPIPSLRIARTRRATQRTYRSRIVPITYAWYLDSGKPTKAAAKCDEGGVGRHPAFWSLTLRWSTLGDLTVGDPAAIGSPGKGE